MPPVSAAACVPCAVWGRGGGCCGCRRLTNWGGCEGVVLLGVPGRAWTGERSRTFKGGEEENHLIVSSRSLLLTEL